MRKFFRYLAVIFVAGPVILFTHIFYVSRYARHPEKYPFEKRYNRIRKEIILVLKLFHVDFKVNGIEKFTELQEKSFIVCNHLSDLDPLIFIACSEKPVTFISKVENFKVPFLGKCMKALESFPLDRKNLMNQIGQIRDIVKFLKDPSKPSVIVYIEGTRNRKPEESCLEFHPGTLKIAQMAGTSIMTYANYGTFRVLDMHSYLHRCPVFIEYTNYYDKDMVKAQSTTDFAVALKEEMDKNVDILRRKDKEYINNLKHSKKRKQLETIVDRRADA